MQKHWQKMATVTKFIIGIKNNKSFPQEIILGIDNAEIATIKAHTHPHQKKVQKCFSWQRDLLQQRTWKLCLLRVSVPSSE